MLGDSLQIIFHIPWKAPKLPMWPRGHTNMTGVNPGAALSFLSLAVLGEVSKEGHPGSLRWSPAVLPQLLQQQQ